MDQLLETMASNKVEIAIAFGVGMFLGWMVGFVRGHAAGLRERSARLRSNIASHDWSITRFK